MNYENVIGLWQVVQPIAIIVLTIWHVYLQNKIKRLERSCEEFERAHQTTKREYEHLSEFACDISRTRENLKHWLKRRGFSWNEIEEIQKGDGA